MYHHHKSMALPLIAVFVTSLCISLPLCQGDASVNGSLRSGFYNNACPQVEEIVRGIVFRHFLRDPTIPAGLLRLFFHDCFVRGCDASILLDKTPSGEAVEKESPANGKSLRGTDVVDDIKAVLEGECPGIVSCADILAFATRDAAVLAGLPRYPVDGGRRDGLVSLASETRGNIPAPFHSIQNLTNIFAKKGFDQTELVILSGAHSIGSAHCSSFNTRLYNFSAETSQDPSLPPFYAGYLQLVCPKRGSFRGSLLADRASLIKVDFDSGSSLWLDGAYYNKLLQGKGLLSSDQALMTDDKTRAVVEGMAMRPDKWAVMFGKAMMKLGAVDVLFGDQGEVRRSCRLTNSMK